MNISTMWMHVMKRPVAPGNKIPLDELYEQYGKKHDIKEGDDFVAWLKAVKVKDTQVWKIVYGEKLEKVTKDVVSDVRIVEEDKTPTQTIRKMTVQDVVELSVRKGREVLPKITDLKLLKYAFQEANQLTGKDSLCNVIRKRIKDLELGR
jgi:hypothetical protein